MKKMTLSLLFVPGFAFAQTTTAAGFGPPILNAPYSVVRSWEQHKVGPDGKKVESRSVMKMYRDSAGRTRTEKQIDHADLISTTVVDRAARVEYWWNNRSKICMMKKLGEALPARDATQLAVGDVRTRSLGTGDAKHKEVVTGVASKTIEGMETWGVHTVQYAPGSDTVTSTSDTFFQPELHLNLYQEIEDAARGHQIWRFHDLKREEPRAELFAAPPKGYTVKESENPNEDKFE